MLSYGRTGTLGTSTLQQFDSLEAGAEEGKREEAERLSGSCEGRVRWKHTVVHRVVESIAATTNNLAFTLWRFKLAHQPSAFSSTSKIAR
jgi:hypothetical protein